MHKPARALLVGVILAVSVSCAQAPQQLFELGGEITSGPTLAPEVTAYEVMISLDALEKGEGARLTVPLPVGPQTAILRPVDPTEIGLDPETAAWTGRFEKGEGETGEVFIVRTGASLMARITFGDWVYRLRTIDGIRGILEVIDPRGLLDHPPGVAPPVEPPSPDYGGAQPDSACLDAADRIDIMVVYTALARDDAGGNAAMENEIAFAVGEVNLAYSNSQVPHRLNLVYTGAVSYDEATLGGASTTLLDQLEDTSDGVLDPVHGLRDTHKADLVSLVTADGDCGWGNTVEVANADTTDHRAFSVLNRLCLTANISLAHETGHNLGALHDRANAANPSTLTPPYNHGHIQPVPSGAADPWRTVLSYNDPCATDAGVAVCQRVTQYSNPDVDFDGDPTGVALTETDPEHNVMVFADNDQDVAKYRCGDTGDAAANVWGKDRWEDTGLEPDPATAGKSMWHSPYIWVRNSQDANLEHEHEHEDPELGQTNFVYVKLHNDGQASETGDVELYFASASTNLDDPANWTLLAAQNQTIATGVEVFEFQWNNLPGTGHYCLLARWNEDATPLSFTSIDAEVRNNSDVIWRNVNIVDLETDSGDEYVFMIVGAREVRETFLVLRGEPRTVLDLPWLSVARPTLTIDAEVLPGRQPIIRNLEPLGEGRFQASLDASLKIIGPLRLDPGQTAKVALRFDANPDQVKALSQGQSAGALYEFTAMQVHPEAIGLLEEDARAAFSREGMILGGVSYMLRIPSEQK